MKKIFLTFACAVAMTVTALGQTVNWSSISAAAMTAQTNTTQTATFGDFFAPFGGAQGATAGAQTGALFYYALMHNTYTGSQAAAPTTVAALNTWKFSGLMATNSNTAGRLAPVAGTTAAIVPWAAGFTNSIMMLGWSANMGSTWGAVSNLLNNQSSFFVSGLPFIGVSTTGYIAPANSDPGVVVFGALPTTQGLPINSLNTQLFLFVPGPEPSTLALLGLGGAALLAGRRRKK